MSLYKAALVARRELRGGLAEFRVFLVCLALGVAAIAAVGSVRSAIEKGLTQEGAKLLGGDAEITLTYRRASETELAWMKEMANKVSEVFDFRSMVVAGLGDSEEHGLTQVKSVDGYYPLVGSVVLRPPMSLDAALQAVGDVPGAVMESVLADRLDLSIGDEFRLGSQSFRLSAYLDNEPDNAGDGFGLGPRTLVRTAALANSTLLAEGTMFETRYRLDVAESTSLDTLADEAEGTFRNAGMRWRDARNGAPGLSAFVDRLGAFLVLVGLAGLAVGGVGVSVSVHAYLQGKREVIAILKTLGAESRTIFLAYLLQICALAALGVLLGLFLGTAAPLFIAPLIEDRLPVPAAFGVYPIALMEAAFYGLLTACMFALWPLARTEEIRPATLFRDQVSGRMRIPRPRYVLLTIALAMLLVGSAAIFTSVPRLTFYSALGVCGSLGVLVLAAHLIRYLSRQMVMAAWLRGKTETRLALGAIGGPGGETTSIVVSLGLGLTVLAAVGQIDRNLRDAISRDLPDVAPSYFVVDIQPGQIDGFRERLASDAGVSRVDTAPMLRGVITRINGDPAIEAIGEHWVLNGDRGVTYSSRPSARTTITQGAWWAEDYAGPPQVSFSAEEAVEMGLQLGDMLTVNILGRDIEAEIASFREVDFSTAGIGFILSMNPSALSDAPHSHIATIYAAKTSEAAILRDLASAYPNITAIRVRDIIERVTVLLSGIATAVSYAAAASLLTGGAVLIGTVAASQQARMYECAILKTVGATRRQVLTYLMIRAGLLGTAAGLVAILCGGLSGWAVTTFVMETEYSFEPFSALGIVLSGLLATLLAGVLFAWRPLSVRPVQVLRNRE